MIKYLIVALGLVSLKECEKKNKEKIGFEREDSSIKEYEKKVVLLQGKET